MIEVRVNKKFFFDYEPIKFFEAGISLKGSEVKKIKNNKFDFNNSYVTEISGELFMKNFFVESSLKQHDISNKNRNNSRFYRLLLWKKEILFLKRQVKLKNVAIVPYKIFLKGKKRIIKVSIALARGLKKYQKKVLLKQKDNERIAKQDLTNLTF